MSHTTFSELLRRYQLGDVSDEEKQLVERWYALVNEQPRHLPPTEWENLEDRIWQKLEHNTQPKTRRAVRPLNSIYLWVKVAAAVALIALTIGLITNTQWWLPGSAMLGESEHLDLEYIRNNNTQDLVIPLEDGSSVCLTPGSELRFPATFESQLREVQLTGEGFFEVAQDPDRPFFVNSGQITTKVLGTSFRIKAGDGDTSISVAVKTGKVTVFEKSTNPNTASKTPDQNVVLTPNQLVTFSKETREFVTGIVAKPLMLEDRMKSSRDRFNYNDTQLSKILKDLQSAYQIELELADNSIGECPITANLSQKELFVQLDLISAAIQGSYAVSGTKIIMRGKGCDD